MKWKKAGAIAGVTAGVFLGMKYVFPVVLPFFCGWILAEAVHPGASYLADRKFFRRMHLTESGIGAAMILLWTVAAVGAVLLSAEYLTAKIGICIRYYPDIKQEAMQLIGRCCKSAERITGIPAGKSSGYIYTQIDSLGEYFWKNNNGMHTAVDSVKGCITVIGMLMIAIVFSVLFLQERDKIKRAVENRRFFKKLIHLGKGLIRDAKAYLKAQIKIMIWICALCIMGLWVIGIRHFVSIGLVIGVLDAFPVFGTGAVLIPGGIIFLLQGKEAQGAGFFILYLLTAGIRQFLEPRLVGSHIGVSPLLVIISVYLGVVLYGGAGLILGPLSGLLLYGILKEWDLLPL